MVIQRVRHDLELEQQQQFYMVPRSELIDNDNHLNIVVIQSLSHVRLFATPRTTARQASLSFTISQSLFKLMSIESMMSSNHLILCHLLKVCDICT